jgi:hypothetical protein
MGWRLSDVRSAQERTFQIHHYANGRFAPEAIIPRKLQFDF